MGGHHIKIGEGFPSRARWGAIVGNHKPQIGQSNHSGSFPHSTIQNKHPPSGQHENAWEIVIIFALI